MKEIVTHHGGKIEVKSRLNKGTAMSVYLPLEKKDVRHSFDGFSRRAKMTVFLITYPFNPSFVYRMHKAVESGDKKHLASTIISFPIMYLVWLYDMATLVTENKIR